MVVISSYNRPEMLMKLVKELHGKDDIVIVDDGSAFDATPFLDYAEFYRFQHKGREGYWLQYQYMFEIAQESDHKWLMFIQDDVSDVQFDEIKKVCNAINPPYAFNFMSRGSDRRWTNTIWTDETIAGVECKKMGYVDCNFCVPRISLDILQFKMRPVPETWLRNTFRSSGVGRQLSKRFADSGIPMFMAKKSLAYHGAHESVMHHRERKRNPLVSK